MRREVNVAGNFGLSAVAFKFASKVVRVDMFPEPEPVVRGDQNSSRSKRRTDERMRMGSLWEIQLSTRERMKTLIILAERVTLPVAECFCLHLE